jgi:outer membrane lipoprotein SlyB
MNNASPKPKLHPMLWVAAASVTVMSLVGIAKFTGVLPDTDKPPAAPEAPPPRIAEAPPAQQAAHQKSATAPKPRPAAAHPNAVAALPPPPGSPAEPAPPPPPPPPSPLRCHDCGVIETIQVQQIKGEGSGLGAIGGAILGGVLGHQVGEGSGKQLARIGGAVLGGFAGNEVERRERASQRYEITVRLDDGSRRVISRTSPPPWQPGERVRVEGDEILPAPHR